MTRQLLRTAAAIVAVSLAGGATLEGVSAHARAGGASTSIASAQLSQAPTERPSPRRANWSAGSVAVWTGYHTSGGSDRVREVQRTLRRVGYSPGPADGLFGPRTEQAVLGFQRAQGLRPDAIVGPITLRALRSVVAADRPPDSATRSPGRPRPGSRRHPAPAPREIPTGDPMSGLGPPWPGILLTLGVLMVLIGGAAVAALAKRRRGGGAPPRPVRTPSAEPAAPAPRQASGGALWASDGAAGAGGSPRRRLGELLRESGALSERELIGALEEQADSGWRLGEILVAYGVVPAATLTAALARQLGFETLRRADEPIPLLSAEEAQTWRAVALDGSGRRDGAIPVALADPTVGLVETLEARLARPVVPRLCDEGALDELLGRVYATDDAYGWCTPPAEHARLVCSPVARDGCSVRAPRSAPPWGVRSDRGLFNGDALLVAPAAVRMVELERPLVDVHLPQARHGGAYRSLLALARLDGDPLGAAVIPVDPEGLVPGDRLRLELRRQLDTELIDAFGRRGLELPASLPEEGVPVPRPGLVVTSARGPSVSVVATTCRNPVQTERCLRSILACDYREFEVIVVENRPGLPTTPRMLAEQFGDDPRVRYVEEPLHGLARARNAGLKVAHGEVVAFTDDDVIVDSAWVARCAEAFERADDIACVTGLILPLELETDGQLLLEQFAGFSKGFQPRIWRLPAARESHPLLPYTPGVIGSGANTALRADIAAKLGGFDTRLGAGTPAAGGEDLDLYIRLLREGCVVAYEPSVLVWHEHPEALRHFHRRVYRYGVGLAATMTKQLISGPDRRELLSAVPAGLRYALDPVSPKNARKGGDYPRRLNWIERFGMLLGPAAYMASALGTAVRHRVPLRRTLPSTVEAGHPAEAGRAERVARPPAVASPAERALAATAAAFCFAALLSVGLGLPAWLRFAAVLGTLCLAPGAVLIGLLGGRAEELGLVLGTSLAVSAVLAQSMLWLGAWQPEAYLYVLAAACLPPLVARVHVSWRKPPDTPLEPLRNAAAGLTPSEAVHGAVVVTALAVWGASLMGADLSRMAGLGLLNAMPPTFFLAFALLLAGFTVAVTREQLVPKLLGLYVLVLILVVHGTTPLLYDQPRYQWVYNHFAVMDLIARAGSVDRTVDIYNNWPGFFALNAWISSVGGLRPPVYGAWAQVFFNLANVAALRFALRGLTSDDRLIWVAVLLFVLGNWVGQDYLAPQAFGFALSLVILGLCLRCGYAPRAARWRGGRWWAAALDRVRQLVLRRAPVDDPQPPVPLSGGAAVVLGGICFLAVVFSHQLTPVMLIGGVTGLALITRRVPVWIPVAMAAIEAWWLWRAWPYFRLHFTLVSVDPTASTAPKGYRVGQGLPHQELVTYGAAAEYVLMAGLASIGAVRRVRAGHWDLAAVTLVIVPMLVVLAQSYGGEGRQRVYLFALPWLCFFAASACTPRGRSRGPRILRSWRIALASGAAGTSLLFSYFGLEYMNYISRDDVAAAVWFNEHAPRSSLFVAATTTSVSRVTAGYARVSDPRYTTSPVLRDHVALPGRKLGRKDVARIERALLGYGARHTFLAVTESQRRMARLYGILPDGWDRRLEEALRRSPSFQLVYRRGKASIYEYRPRPGGGS